MMASERPAGRRRAPRWLVPWAALTALLVVLVLVDPGSLATRPDVGIAVRHGTEALLVGGLLLVALRPTTARLRWPWVIAAVGVGALFAAAQWLPGPPDLHPVVRWDMYTAPTSRVPWTEWTVVARDGSEQPAPFDAVLPTPRRPFIDQLDPWLDRVVAGDVDATALLDRTVTRIVDQAGGVRPDHVRASRCEIAAPDADRRPRCTVVHVVELGGRA